MTDQTKHFSPVQTFLICLVVLAAALLFSWVIFSTEPEAQREGATRQTAMLVQTSPVKVGDHTPVIEAMGTVLPSRSIALRARVSGQVISRSEQLIPGRIVRQGELLLQLDPADYQIELTQRQSALSQAQADLQIEMGEQMAAEQDLARLGREVTATQKSLILRQPQLTRVRAELASAEALLDQARLNLERTEITAPFDAQLQSIQVDLGSQVAVGDTLADLVGIDRYWIEATLPVDQLAWIAPADQDQPTAVTIHDPQAWSPQRMRQGTLISVLGQVDASTRMARVMIAVEDPLGLDDDQLPSLTLGAFVAVRIPARTLSTVARIDRRHVRQNDTLWLMIDRQLSIRPLNVVYRDEQYVYVRDSLDGGEQMVTTDLSRVVEGADLRLEVDAR